MRYRQGKRERERERARLVRLLTGEAGKWEVRIESECIILTVLWAGVTCSSMI